MAHRRRYDGTAAAAATTSTARSSVKSHYAIFGSVLRVLLSTTDTLAATNRFKSAQENAIHATGAPSMIDRPRGVYPCMKRAKEDGPFALVEKIYRGKM